LEKKLGFRNQEEQLAKGEISTPSGGRCGQKKFLTIMKGKKRKGKNIASLIIICRTGS
jgi:hypothetical protein